MYLYGIPFPIKSMDIKKALLAEHSRIQMDKIARFIGKDSLKFKILMSLFFSNNTILNQRAAWVMCLCFENSPSLITPYLKKIIYNLEKDVHDAVKRNTVKILQDIEIPESLLGKTADTCFTLLSNSSEALAVKVFSMSVLLNITKKEPDLKNELKILIENQLPYASAGFLSRGKKVLKALEKIN